jgi:hypothetical protein
MGRRRERGGERREGEREGREGGRGERERGERYKVPALELIEISETPTGKDTGYN